MFTAWGFSNNTWTYGQFADKAKAAGYTWAALELDDYGGWTHWAEFNYACLTRGIKSGIWVTKGGNIQAAPNDVDFLIAELEGPDDYNGIVSAIERMPAWMHEIPKAVVTNFNAPLSDISGYHPDKAAPLIEAGFSCITEAYLGDNPNATPERLDFAAKQLGWDYTIPAFGAWNQPLMTYEPWMDWPHGYCVYTAENVL